MKSTYESIGTITLGDLAQVTDPCYEHSSFYSASVKVLTGQWKCRVRIKELKHWGKRVVAIEARHKDYPKGRIAEDHPTILVVDSGQLGVFDASYYKINQPDDDWDNPASWYRRVCDLTCNVPYYGIIDGQGAVCESGIGDGAYYLQVTKNADGLVVGMRVRFV